MSKCVVNSTCALYLLESQALRTENPFLGNPPNVINVELNSLTEVFKFDNLLAGKYTLHLLAGQHITECDKRLLKGYYSNTPPDQIPGPMKIKATEIYVNLTKAEESMIVTVDNNRLRLDNQFWDKVRRINFPLPSTVKILSMLLLRLLLFFIKLFFVILVGGTFAETHDRVAGEHVVSS